MKPTERSPRAQNADAMSRGTRDSAVRLRHVEPARVPLRHDAPRPPQLPDSLHRMAKEQSHLPRDFLSGYAYEDGKLEHRGYFTQEADSVRGICGAHGGYETAKVRDVRRTGGRAPAAWGGREKKRMGCFLDDLRTFSINADQRTTAAQDEVEWRKTA